MHHVQGGGIWLMDVRQSESTVSQPKEVEVELPIVNRFLNGPKTKPHYDLMEELAEGIAEGLMCKSG